MPELRSLPGWIYAVSNTANAANSVVSLNPDIADIWVGETNTVFVQALDVMKDELPIGGDIFYLIVEQSGIITLMNDNGDGTYDADYTISEEGPNTISVFLNSGGGLTEDYFASIMDRYDNLVAETRVVGNIDYNWGTGPIGLLVTQQDNCSVRWVGYLYAPLSEDFTFFVFADDLI